MLLFIWANILILKYGCRCIGQPMDIGDIQVVPVQGKEKKKLEITLRDIEYVTMTFCK